MEKVGSKEATAEEDSRCRGDSGDTESSSCSSSDAELVSFTLKSGEGTSPPFVAKIKAPENVFTFSSNLFDAGRTTASWMTPPLPPGGTGNRFSQPAASTTAVLRSGRYRRNAFQERAPSKSPSSPPLARNLFDKTVAPPIAAPACDMYISDDDESTEATTAAISCSGSSSSRFHDLIQMTSRRIYPAPPASPNLPRFSPPPSRDPWTSSSLPTSRASSPGFQASMPTFPSSTVQPSSIPQRRSSYRKVALGHRRTKSLSSGTAPSFRNYQHHRQSCGRQPSRASSVSFLPPLLPTKTFEDERKDGARRSNLGCSGRISPSLFSSPLVKTSLKGRTRASSASTCLTFRTILFRVVTAFVAVFTTVLYVTSILQHERSLGTFETQSPGKVGQYQPSPVFRALSEARNRPGAVSASSPQNTQKTAGRQGAGTLLGSFLPVHLSPSRRRQEHVASPDNDIPLEFQQPLQSSKDLSQDDSKLSRRSIRQTSALMSQSNDENDKDYEFSDRRGRLDGTSASSADVSTTVLTNGNDKAEETSSEQKTQDWRSPLKSASTGIEDRNENRAPGDGNPNVAPRVQQHTPKNQANEGGKRKESRQKEQPSYKANTAEERQKENSNKTRNKEQQGGIPAVKIPSNSTAQSLKFPHGKVKRISLLGERNSGTRWMVEELQRCFPDMRVDGRLLRWKHWFQEYDSPKHTPTYVVAQFRNVYEWVEAMRHTNHHAPAHSLMDWPSFVQTPWTMERTKRDLDLLEEAKRKPHILNEPICHEQFYYHQLNSCVLGTQSDPEYRATFDNVTKLNKYGHEIDDPHDFTAYQPMYELKNDGSGEPYDSILDLRADKIRNFMSVGTWPWVAEVLPVQYEDLLAQGTESVIRRIEEVTGVRRSCEETSGPQTGRRRRELEPAFVKYVTEHVDWDAEAMVGYKAWDDPTFHEFLRWELRTTSSSGDSDSKDLPKEEQERLMDAAVNRAKDKMSGKIVDTQRADGNTNIEAESERNGNGNHHTSKSAVPDDGDETNFDNPKLAMKEETVTVRAPRKYPIQRRKLISTR